MKEIFPGVAGNALLKERLAPKLLAGDLPHALILEGKAGSGRRTFAREIAMAAACENRADPTLPLPCGKCEACRKIGGDLSPDILRMARAPGKMTLGVEAVRGLRESVRAVPNDLDLKIYIIEDADTMTVQAQNALLKILEEPPAHACFILTCENRTQMLETIRSRCVVLTMQPVDWADAAPLLRERLPGRSDEELHRALELFGGFLGQVIAGVGDGTFARALELTPQFAQALIAPDELTLLTLTGKLEKDKELTVGVLTGLRLVLRDALAVSVGQTAMISTAPEAARALAGRLTGARLMALLRQTEELLQAQQRNMNNTLFLARMSACLRQAAGA